MRKKSATTSSGVDNLRAELVYAGDRGDLLRRISRLEAKLLELELDDLDRRLIELGRGEKKNFAQRFSTGIALKIANALRPHFTGIQPTPDGKGHESLSKSASGLKKIDVNYSTQRSGLELAISIKTMNFKDEVTGRYTKNTRRIDGELRAEAADVHHRQPYAVVAGYLFLPLEAASDGDVSSLKHNAQVLAQRSGRVDVRNDISHIECAYIVLYTDSGEMCVVRPDSVPDHGIPKDQLTLSSSLSEIRSAHAVRNRTR
jgi:hypothetical protein